MASSEFNLFDVQSRLDTIEELAFDLISVPAGKKVAVLASSIQHVAAYAKTICETLETAELEQHNGGSNHG